MRGDEVEMRKDSGEVMSKHQTKLTGETVKAKVDKEEKTKVSGGR